VRTAPRFTCAGATLVALAALAALAVRADELPAGQQMYAKYCLSCHQADGRGVPGMQPSIVGGNWIKGDARALAAFVLSGGFGSAQRKEGPVENVMPEFSRLGDDELAALLTFARAKFGAGASPVSAADVASARASLK
jgi:mono/diheme cytochrome c family protein